MVAGHHHPRQAPAPIAARRWGKAAWAAAALAGLLSGGRPLAAAGDAASGGVGFSWPRPAAVQELVADPARFRIFAQDVSRAVARALAAQPAPVGTELSQLLSLRVHLGLHLGDDAAARAAAVRIREEVAPPAERALAGLLTEALVESRERRSGGPGGAFQADLLRGALVARLRLLPEDPGLAAALRRQGDRLRALSRQGLEDEAARLGARLDAAPLWTLADVDEVVRVGHRLGTILPVRDEILAQFDLALARLAPAAPFPVPPPAAPSP